MANTIQAHGVRGFATPEQVSAANDKAEALAGRLYHLTEVVKLAAFAAEARRTLNEVYGAANSIPFMKETIQNSAFPADNWSSLEDNTGNVLVSVAMELAAVNNAFTDHADELVRLLSSPCEAGGAA